MLILFTKMSLMTFFFLISKNHIISFIMIFFLNYIKLINLLDFIIAISQNIILLIIK